MMPGIKAYSGKWDFAEQFDKMKVFMVKYHRFQGLNREEKSAVTHDVETVEIQKERLR